MTAMLERFWTPAGEIPVEQLLRPGTDPEKDLGMALLAVHRAGAEACELVAKTAVADEHVLVAALAETRAQVAPQAVHVVSKAVEGPAYAGLLLADLLDDAEIAALALYRTCLSKSVAPPIAAQRVGMVFGCPSRALGRYSALASDPKANPVAVQDAADRALFEFVAKTVADEYVPAKELVSKAPVRDYHGREPGERDSDGQFARVRAREAAPGGLNLQALFDQAAEREKVATTPAEAEVTPGPPEVAQRQTRATRKVRQVRRTRATVESQQAQQTQQGQSLQGQSLRRSVLNQQLSAQALLGQELVTPLGDAPWPLAGQARSPGDVLSERQEKDLGEIKQGISYVLPADEFLALARAAGDGPGGEHVLRLGGIDKYAGTARLYENANGDLHEHHQDGVETVIDLIKTSPDYAGQVAPRVGVVPMAKLIGQDPDAALRAAKQRFVEMQVEKLGIRVNMAEEVSRVEHSPLGTDLEQMALMWRPPTTDGQGRPAKRSPIEHIVEVVVTAGQAEGRVGADGRVEVNPNQPVRMASLFNRRAEAGNLSRRSFFDPNLGAIRTVVTMKASDEDTIIAARKAKFGGGGGPKEPFAMRDSTFGKAEQVRERPRQSDYLDLHNVVNGPGGRFVAEGDVDLQRLFDQARAREVRPATVRRTRKVARVRRTSTTSTRQEAQQTSQAQQLKGQRAGQRGAQQLEQAALRQRLREKTDPFKNLVWFDDGEQYTPVTPATMDQLFTELKQRGLAEDAHAPITLDAQARHTLLMQGGAVGQAAEMQVGQNTIDAWNAQRAGRPESARLEKRVVTHTLVGDSETEVEDLWGVAAHLGDLFSSQPTLQALRVKMTRRQGKVTVTVYGNVEDLPAQHLLRYADSADPGNPRRLVPELETKRTQNAYTIENWLRQTYYSMNEMSALDVEDELANPRVKTWLVE